MGAQQQHRKFGFNKAAAQEDWIQQGRIRRGGVHSWTWMWIGAGVEGSAEKYLRYELS